MEVEEVAAADDDCQIMTIQTNPDDLLGAEDNANPEREGESPPINLPSTPTGYDWREIETPWRDRNPSHG